MSCTRRRPTDDRGGGCWRLRSANDFSSSGTDRTTRRWELAVSAVLDARGACLIIDAHSFPSVPLPYEVHQDADRPDICIGTDDFHTPTALLETVERLCRNAGWTVAVNKPFAGALVPVPYFRADSRVHAVMIEVNRRLYLNEASATRGPRFDSCRSKLRTVMHHLIEERFVSRDWYQLGMGRAGDFRRRAEPFHAGDAGDDPVGRATAASVIDKVRATLPETARIYRFRRDGSVQFSVVRPFTRVNSVVLFVTSVNSRDRA